MRPLRFEQTYRDEWSELEASLDEIAPRKGRTTRLLHHPPGSGARVATLYRHACDHLALARARAYPAYIVDRLERMTARAHQAIYYRQEYGIARLRRFVTHEFPSTVRSHSGYVTVAAVVFLLPTLVLGVLVYMRPELILSVVSSDTAASFEEMYSPAARSIGRARTASTDWMMFGYYIRNNITIAFQCFASGLFGGIGSVFFLAYNGAVSGAVAGYLTSRGFSSTFYPFISTHSAFELTAIVLSGAAGLRIGHALLAPGRLARIQSLTTAARDAIALVYGVAGMLLIAAIVEAFWSSSSWLPVPVKYGVAAACWTAVLGYFAFQGRRAD